MTYVCGFGPGMAGLGIEPGPPHIFCDTCGLKYEAKETRGGAPAWLRNGTAPKGWLVRRTADGQRRDYCPRHKATQLESAAEEKGK
jgi:hypothetical protein